ASRVSAKPILPPSKRSNSLRQTSGRPETRAIPSPTRSTRPKDSASAARSVAATVFRLRASQSSPGASSVACVMVHQLGFEQSKIGAEAVTHDRLGSFEFDASDERGIDRDFDRDRVSKDASEGRTAGAFFLRSHRTGRRQLDRLAL